jgi:hypothetical protein
VSVQAEVGLALGTKEQKMLDVEIKGSWYKEAAMQSCNHRDFTCENAYTPLSSRQDRI